MNYKVVSTLYFDKELKKLAKKYPSIKDDILLLVEELGENPTKGTSLGKNCYKIRLAIKSKGKGKSAGGRVITYIEVADDTIYLLTIYDKSDQSTITTEEINEHLKNLE